MSQPDEFVAWLLAAALPTTRYLTLTRLLGLPADDPQVHNAQADLMQTGPVATILAAQTESGAWPNESSYYTPKYVSTHWSLQLLTLLGVDGAAPGFRRGVQFMLEDTGPAFVRGRQKNSLDLACLWGNILRYTAHAALHDDPRAQAITDRLVRSVAHGGCRCVYNSGLGCAWGVARALWGLAGIPAGQRSPAIQNAIASGVDFLTTQFSLVEANYPVPPDGKIHSLWHRLNFPLFYQVDILFVLQLLAELEALDRPEAQRALDWLRQKRRPDGRWRGSSPYRQRTWAFPGDRSEIDRWVSLQAALLLRSS
ncbi:MAG: hypothetical protein H6651_15660 [Ardenticatenales bacterium]|nr:hypothetical protein [Ardenticatenales bacterium]